MGFAPFRWCATSSRRWSRTKIRPNWLSVTSPVSLTKKFDVIRPSAPANWPSPPSTSRTTLPCLKCGSGRLRASRGRRVKAQPVSTAELDRPEVVEGRMLAKGELAFEHCLSSGDILERASHSVRTDCRHERCARGGQLNRRRSERGDVAGRGIATSRRLAHHVRRDGVPPLPGARARGIPNFRLTELRSLRMLFAGSSSPTLIDEVLDAARERRSGALVLRGEAGIGKDRPVDAAVDRASGMRILRAFGVERKSRSPSRDCISFCGRRSRFSTRFWTRRRSRSARRLRLVRTRSVSAWRFRRRLEPARGHCRGTTAGLRDRRRHWIDDASLRR